MRVVILDGASCDRSGLTFEDESKAAAIKALGLDWVGEEVEWLRQNLCRETDGGADSGASTTGVSSAAEKRANRFLSEVVLCHNDLLSGNVLHADGWDRVQVNGG